MLQRSREAAANHIAQHIEDHHIGFFQQVVFLQQFHRLSGDIPTTAGAGRRTAGFDALHAVVALKDVIFGPQFLGVEVHGFEDIDHRGHHLLGEGEGGIVLGITADLQHPLAQF